MRILFDQGTPAPLRHALVGHVVETAYERGWSRLQNGELIAASEAEGFDVLVTTDSNLRHQQNLAGRRLSMVALLSTSWPRIQRALPRVIAAVDGCSPGAYVKVAIA